jgi:hypothetical protein
VYILNVLLDLKYTLLSSPDKKEAPEMELLLLWE